MNQQHSTQIGALVLRLGLGIVFIAHSLYLKLVVFSLPGTAQFFESIGLPALLAYVVFVLESAGGIALLIGFRTRIVSIALLPVALGATWVHSEAGWLFTNDGGGWEYPLFLAVSLLTQSLIGDGALALKLRHQRARAPLRAPEPDGS
ncbi:MAG TPA: DoxX family protein [Xanthomonadales bacterium]|nr:DoxX family protein [Xanthomonadales bacterium]